MGNSTFDDRDYESNGTRHRVYRTGRGPKVILMHELPGLSPVCLELAKRLADIGYTVLVPLLFGKPGQSSNSRGTFQICVSREFTLLRLNRRSKITDWLRSLAREEDDGRGVAAIGMCATGGLVLGMMLEDSVVTGVASQPSLPFAPRWFPESRKRNLGLPPGDIQRLADLAKPLLALRFKNDGLCPRARVENMTKTLHAKAIEVPDDGGYESCFPPISDKAHSVLTYDHVDLPGHPSDTAFNATLDFLRQHHPPD